MLDVLSRQRSLRILRLGELPRFGRLEMAVFLLACDGVNCQEVHPMGGESLPVHYTTHKGMPAAVIPPLLLSQFLSMPS